MAARIDTQTNAAKVIAIVGPVVLACLLLMVTDYRVLIGEEKPPPYQPDMSELAEPIQIGNVAFDPRMIPPTQYVTCRYFTGRSITTVTFDQSKIDSCPFIYKPKEYENL